MKYSEIFDLCEQRKIKVKELTTLMKMSYGGFKTSIETNKLQADKIELLCTYLKISPNQFFKWGQGSEERDVTIIEGSNNNQNMVTDSIEVLQKQLAEKDAQINRLLTIIESK